MTEIDVSGCKFFITEHIEDGYTEDDGCVYIKNACGINGTECCLVPECYYKQLKSLEQENAKLKEKLEKIKDIVVANYTCKCALEELMNVLIEGAEDEK